MTQYRTEKDSMGELKVPRYALYQAQTQRAVLNFQISKLIMPESFIKALAYIKQAAAQTNQELGLLSKQKAQAIDSACQTLIDGENLEHFPVDVFQTGSGTSSNMNANEVIATLASKIAGIQVHPNDDVNMGQSSNDVIPTAIHISAVVQIYLQLIPAVEHLCSVIEAKSAQIGHVVKTGRTHLMDAMPITFAQVLSGWQHQLETAQGGITSATEKLTKLAQGGTAVGTGINADPRFAEQFANHLSARIGIRFYPSDNFFAGLAGQETAVAVSGQLKVLAVAIMKIANDLRWMNSGPLAGLSEITLEALQPGSSIMPGKVNPVIPEAAAMVAAQVIGNDTTLTVAGQSGNFELNVMLPVIAYNLLQSIELLTNTCHHLADKAIAGFSINENKLNEALGRNPILVTALNPLLGYEKAAQIAKEAYQSGKSVLEVAAARCDIPYEELRQRLNPERLTSGGISGEER